MKVEEKKKSNLNGVKIEIFGVLAFISLSLFNLQLIVPSAFANEPVTLVSADQAAANPVIPFQPGVPPDAQVPTYEGGMAFLANLPPSLSEASPLSVPLPVREIQPLTGPLHLKIREDEKVTFEIQGEPLVRERPGHGLLVDNGSGNFTYAPDEDFSGEDSFTYVDTKTGKEGRAKVTVTPANDAPEFEEWVPPQTAEAGKELTFDVYVSDPDDDLIRLSVNLPAGARFDPETGEFRWTPDHTQVGDEDIVFSAFDGHARAKQVIHIHIAE